MLVREKSLKNSLRKTIISKMMEVEKNKMDTIQELIQYSTENSAYIWSEFYRHFLMAVYGVLFASIISFPLGILIVKYVKLCGWVLSLGSIIQTMPALAMVTVIMIVMGLGRHTAVVILIQYSNLPISQNTYGGMRAVDKTVIEAGDATGMTRFQLHRMVELPLAVSVIMAGIRTALVIGI